MTRSTWTTCAAGRSHPSVLTEATERIMAAITALVAELRGEPAPAEPFDPREPATRRGRRMTAAEPP